MNSKSIKELDAYAERMRKINEATFKSPVTPEEHEAFRAFSKSPVVKKIEDEFFDRLFNLQRRMHLIMKRLGFRKSQGD